MKTHRYISLSLLLIGASVFAQTSPVVRVGVADSSAVVRAQSESKPLPVISHNESVVKASDEEPELIPEKNDDTYFYLQATQNHTTGRAKIQLTTSKSGAADIYLMNFRGDKVKTIYKGQLNSGTSNLSFDTANIGDGLYYIITNLEGQQYADKFLVDRQ